MTQSLLILLGYLAEEPQGFLGLCLSSAGTYHNAKHFYMGPQDQTPDLHMGVMSTLTSRIPSSYTGIPENKSAEAIWSFVMPLQSNNIHLSSLGLQGHFSQVNTNRSDLSLCKFSEYVT